MKVEAHLEESQWVVTAKTGVLEGRVIARADAIMLTDVSVKYGKIVGTLAASWGIEVEPCTEVLKPKTLGIGLSFDTRVKRPMQFHADKKQYLDCISGIELTEVDTVVLHGEDMFYRKDWAR